MTRSSWLLLSALAACGGRVDASLTLPTLANTHLARIDFDGDGRLDLLLGGKDAHTLDKTPFYALRNVGDGTLVDITAQTLAGDVRAATPIPLVGDFNGDGRPDVVVIDAGHLERGQLHGTFGGYFGEEPFVLFSQADGTWRVTGTQLADAYEAAAGSRLVHGKSGSVADVDGDGDLDAYVESGGGAPHVRPHFLINDGLGNFVVRSGFELLPDDSNEGEVSPPTLSTALLTGPSGSWRYFHSAMADFDQDGQIDLALGQLRSGSAEQDALASQVSFGDGQRFRLEGATALPYVAFFDGRTYVSSMLAEDFDGDGDTDLVLAHTRGNVAALPDEPLWTGRWIQLLASDGATGFDDVTQDFITDQTAFTSARVRSGVENNSITFGLERVDLNGDGRLDLFFGESEAPIRDASPVAFLLGAEGTFHAAEASEVTGGDEWFGENAVALSLDGDLDLDVVHLDTDAGPDGTFGTADDRTRVIATLMRERWR